MIRNIYLFFSVVFFCISSEVNSQIKVRSVFKGPEFKTEKSSPQFILKSDSSGYDILYSEGKYGGGSSKIIKFNSGLEPTGKERLLHENDEGFETWKFLTFGDSILHIFSDDDESNRRFYYQWLNKSDYKEKTDPIFIEEIRNRGDDIDDSFVKINYDSVNNSILLVYEVPNYNRDERILKIVQEYLDTDKQVEFEYNFEEKSKNYILYSFKEVSENEYLVLFKYMMKGTQGKFHPDQYEYHLYNLRAGIISKITTIENQGYHLQQIMMFYNDSTKTASIIGYFSEDDMYGVKGTYFNQVDLNTGKSLLKNIQEFPLEVHLENLKEKQKERVRKRYDKGRSYELYRTVIREVYKKNDGFYILGEVHYYSNYVMRYGDFFLTKLELSGKHLWTRELSKNNTNLSGKVRTSTYFSTWFSNDEFIILYNDNINNLDYTYGIPKSAFRYEEEKILNALYIDKEGNYKRHAILQPEQLEGYDLIPFLTDVVKKDEEYLELLVFMTANGTVKKQRFFKVLLEID